MSQITTGNVALLALHIGKLTMMREYHQAIQEADTAIMAFPRCAGLYAQRARLYILVKRDDKALLDLDTACTLQPTVRRHLQRAAFFIQIGDVLEALQDCQEALLIEPGSEEAQASLEAALQLMQLH